MVSTSEVAIVNVNRSSRAARLFRTGGTHILARMELAAVDGLPRCHSLDFHIRRKPHLARVEHCSRRINNREQRWKLFRSVRSLLGDWRGIGELSGQHKCSMDRSEEHTSELQSL